MINTVIGLVVLGILAMIIYEVAKEGIQEGGYTWMDQVAKENKERRAAAERSDAAEDSGL